MNLFKFINLFYKIKAFFSYLPKGMQEELVDDMENYYQLCKIAQLQKYIGGKK